MLKLPYQVSQVENDSVPLVIAPGIVSVLSDRDAQGRWKDGSLVRFANSSGLPQILGGWASVVPLNAVTFKGALRSAHEWQSLDKQFWMALGTNAKLYIYNQGFAYDITPSRRNVTLGSNPFSTTNTSNIVTVTDPLHGAFVGDNIQISGATVVAGLTISGEYTVLSISANSYTINAGSAANATVTGGGGAVVVNYDINAMPVDQSQALGWGAGTWDTPRAPANLVGSITSNVLTVTQIINGVIGSNGTNVLAGTNITGGTTVTAQLSGTTGGLGTYSVTATANVGSEAMTLTQGWDEPATSSNIINPVGIWSLDNWGEDLIASPRGGAIYIWKKSTGPFAKAVLISANAPVANNKVIVSQDARQILAFGSSSGDSFGNPTGPVDPALVRFCASEDYTTWVASVTNNAGSYRLSSGSGIVTVTKSRGGYYMGSTKSAALLYPTGDSNVYGSNALGQSGRPCSPQAAADFNGTTYVMTQDNFQVFDGVLNTMACDVWNSVFNKTQTTALNIAKQEKVTCHINRQFTEVWWNYPSLGGNGENDRYVVYNWTLKCWHYGSWAANVDGTINRSMGHDWGDVFNSPYMGWFNTASVATPNLNGTSTLIQHETGNFAGTSSTFNEFIESWDFDILNSGEITATSHLLPSMKDFVGPSSIQQPSQATTASVIALYHFEDGNAATTFSDDTGNNFFTSAGGSVAVSTAQAKFGASSLSLGTTANDHLQTPVWSAGALWDLLRSDFTIEMFFYRSATATNTWLIDNSDSTGVIRGIGLFVSSGGTLTLQFDNQGVGAITQAGITANIWHHVAVSRVGCKFYLALDGALVGTSSNTTNGFGTNPTGFSGYRMLIGGTNSGGTSGWGGFIDELRIVRGMGLYTAAYTVPSAPFTATLPALPAIYGTPTVVSAQHFEDGNGSQAFQDSALPQPIWNVIGGAVEQTTTVKIGTGAGQFLSTGLGSNITTPVVANAPLDLITGTPSWTIECWVFPIDTSSALHIVWCMAAVAGTLTNFFRLHIFNGAVTAQGFGSWTGPFTAGIGLTASQWHHIALVHHNNLTVIYVDGVAGGGPVLGSPGSLNTGGGSIPDTYQLAADPLSGIQTTGLQGYLDEVVVTKGFAKYTSDYFTPPLLPAPNPQTVFLSSLPVTIKTRKYAADPYKVKGPYSLLSTTQKLSARAKARQMALRIGPIAPNPSTTGVLWTMGQWRVKLGEDGDR